jgi:MFS family permease
VETPPDDEHVRAPDGAAPRPDGRSDPPAHDAKGSAIVGASVATARGVHRAGRAGYRYFRRSTRAEGAEESGLAQLIDVHTVQGAADALLAVALASTLFFQVPTGEARGKVMIYLLVTMAPFAVIAPIVGPLLDRFRRGRRYALFATLLGRCLLAWIMADAVSGSKTGFELYPAAFGVLVLSKAYSVSRSAIVPRVLPPSVSLVRANSRLTLWTTIAAAIGAPIGAGLNWAVGNPSWTLRIDAVIYIAAGILALRLPARVDSAEGEERLTRRHPPPSTTDPTGVTDQPRPSLYRRILPPLHGVGPYLGLMLRGGGALRFYSGFMTMFLAFIARLDPSPIAFFKPNVNLAILVAAFAGGGLLGTVLGGRLKARRPEPLTIAALSVAAASAIAAAIFFGLLTATIVALVAGLAQNIGKLSLDSVIQRDVEEEVRTSAFARSETALQTSWVAGGFIGVVLPSNGILGFSLVAAGLVVVLVYLAVGLRRVSDRLPMRAGGLVRES